MKNVLIIEDVSCFGKCSTTVALPIISKFGLTGTILPTALLSTHTGPEFPGFTVLDLTEEIKKILAHWQELNIKFDAIYTGYLGKIEQIDLLIEAIPNILKEDGKIIIDPVFGDNGKLYYGFDEAYALENRKLAAIADVLVPNITEACYLVGRDFNALTYTPEERQEIINELLALGSKTVVLTGVSTESDNIGAAYSTQLGQETLCLDERIPQQFHGTGDIFGSVLVGEYIKTDNNIDKAVAKAVAFVPNAIKATINDSDPITYGVHFEKVIDQL